MERPQFMPDIDIDRLTPGRQTDWLVATYVLGWKEWKPGMAVHHEMFVVNPATHAIERCLDTEWLQTPTAYPECAGSYHFSTDLHDAFEAYRVVAPLQARQWDRSPLDVCKEALRRKLRETPNENV